MICINCIAEEMDKFTWKKEYIIDGNIISVDIPIYILDENELEVYDCTSYTEYIKNRIVMIKTTYIVIMRICAS